VGGEGGEAKFLQKFLILQLDSIDGKAWRGKNFKRKAQPWQAKPFAILKEAQAVDFKS
jgi:hypothetical protein